MLLIAIFLTFLGIPHLADTNPPKLSELSFKKLLDTCTGLQNSNLTDCQYFISTYRWLYDDVHLVFDKVLEKNNASLSPAENILETRLINLIENPNFDLKSLRTYFFYRAIKGNKEPLAIAIWTHLKKYKNNYFDAQLHVCSIYMPTIMEMKMLQLLKKMVKDRPDCLNQVTDLWQMAIDNGCGLDIFLFLYDQGLEITAADIEYLGLRRKETFFGAVRKYPYSFFLKAVEERFQGLAENIWNVLKSENYFNVLLQICNNNIINAVNDNMFTLVRIMYNDFPECILSKGDILMDIAVRGGMNKESMILFLYDHGVEITNGLVIRDPQFEPESGFRAMILFLSDVGVKITPEHLQILSSYENTLSYEWAILLSQLTKENFLNSTIQDLYFGKVLLERRFDLFEKIVGFNILEIQRIKELISNYVHNVSERERFVGLLGNDSKVDIATQAQKS